MSKTARQHAAALIASAEEALQIARGERAPARVYTARDVVVEAPPTYSAAEIRAIRGALRVSQQVFAAMLNVSDKTVHAWEQGAREPEGPTLRLLELAKHDPAVMMQRVVPQRQAKGDARPRRDPYPARVAERYLAAKRSRVEAKKRR